MENPIWRPEPRLDERVSRGGLELNVAPYFLHTSCFCVRFLRLRKQRLHGAVVKN